MYGANAAGKSKLLFFANIYNWIINNIVVITPNTELANYEAYDDVVEGDIIAFKRGDIKVTHRVAEVTGRGLVTKGDANDVKDSGRVTEKYYLGKTILWIPELGRVAAFFKTVPGMILLGMIVLLMIVASTVLGRKDSGNKDQCYPDSCHDSM